ncbi:nuclear RNA export factor 2-like isoform X3 [Ochotona princeps]|uniref:nuclear RNA export factor 2-like isoform X3 n=1 Tax=Ochotona princeps TaxID=9978 RepID=UPI0027155F42|nr:nuclear RNA export factor 2-like isoform X3 [Ochotona princeps]
MQDRDCAEKPEPKFCDGTTHHERMKKDWDLFHRRLYQENLQYEHGVSEPPPSHHQEADGAQAMVDAQEDAQLQCTSYTTQYKKRTVKVSHHGQIHTPLCRFRKHPRKDMRGRTQDGTASCWFKVTIPYARKYNKTKLMTSIQSYCALRFVAVDFHYIRNQACFFIQDEIAASALRDVSEKIRDDDNRKIAVFVHRSAAPYSVQNQLKPEEMQLLKRTLYKRYDANTKRLDLQSLRLDPDLMHHHIDMILNQRQCMAATLQIIGTEFPELLALNLCNNKLYHLDGLSDILDKAPKVKTLNLCDNEIRTTLELEKVKELKLEELWLKGNPLYKIFPDHAAYVRKILDCFPNLSRLDGKDLSPPVAEMDAQKTIKPSEKSSQEIEMIKNLILNFLHHYYFIYDYGDRHTLINVYHEKAYFSLTTGFNSTDPVPTELYKYAKTSRNIKNITEANLRRQLLKHTNHVIVDTLNMLPKTRHYFSSFSIDTCFYTEKSFIATVKGIFRGESTSENSVFGFIRTFVGFLTDTSTWLRTHFPDSVCILNDHLFVSNTNPGKVRNSFSIVGAIPCSRCPPTLSLLQEEMVHAFSQQSAMKLSWSQKCLEDNGWNFTSAVQAFSTLQDQGVIPKEAFKKST